MAIAPFRAFFGIGLVIAAFLLVRLQPAVAQVLQFSSAPVRLAFVQGGADEVGLAVRLAPGWKFYWRTPGEGGVPAQFDWSASRNLARADVLWPAPQRIPLGQNDIYGYTDEVVLPLRVERQDPSQPVQLNLMLEYGVCKDICILRSDRVHQGGVSSAADQALLAKWQARVPQAAAAADLRLQLLRLKPELLIVALHSAMPLQAPDLFVEGTPDSWFGRPQVALMNDRREIRFELPVTIPPGATGRPLRLTLVDPALTAELVVQP